MSKEYENECRFAWERFKQTRNLSKEIPDCPFDIDIELPEKPKDPKKIANYGLPKEKRKFPYYNLFELKEWLKNPDGKHFVAFMKQEWDRRINGYWFYNGDNLEYITGDHYMFLQYWTLEGTVINADGKKEKQPIQPYFIDMQRDWYYAWSYCKEDERCLGMIFVGRRRTAKTELAISEGYWHATRSKAKKFFIQSKNDEDSKEIFDRIIYSWQNLPYIWRPTDRGQNSQSKQLEFKAPIKRDTKSKQSERKNEEVLNSVIAWKPSGDTGIDSRYASRILNDEVFKTPKKIADIKKRTGINKKCLVDGSSVVGKMLLTSTVEEVDKDGIDHMIELIDESDLGNRNKVTGRTVSGMYPLFFPAYYGYSGEHPKTKEPLTDEWGYSNMELSKEVLTEERFGLKGADLIGEKRRNPFTLQEAFYIDSKLEIFSQEHLQSQNTYNKESGVYDYEIRRGNFYWRDGVQFGEVAWEEDPHGRWYRYKDSPESNRNNKRLMGGHWHPTGRTFFSGCDPVDHGRVRYGSGSMAVSHVISMPNPDLGLKRKTFVCQYAYRHTDPNLFYEDILMQCIYYNSPILVENQKKGLINYFEDHKFGGYCMYDPTETDPKKVRRGDKGFPTTGPNTRDYMIRLGQSYINENVGFLGDTQEYCEFPFKETIDDLLKFDPVKWTPHDYAVSFLVTLVATTQNRIATTNTLDIMKFLPHRNRRR